MIAKEERNQSNQKLDYWKLYIVTECKVKDSCQEENAPEVSSASYTLHIAHNGTLHHTLHMNVDYALCFQVALKHKMHKIGTKKSLSAFFS